MTALDFVADLKTHGLTQVQIAERAKIPQSTVSKIERGTVKDVMSETYLKLQSLWRDVANEKTKASA